MTRRLRIAGEPAFRTRFANPYNARLYSAIMQRGPEVRDLKFHYLLTSTPDIVHMHWPELTFLSGHRKWRVIARLLVFFSMLRIARLRGTRLIWTAHNVGAHETRSTPALRKLFRRWWCANVDAVISLTEDGMAAVRTEFPELAEVPAFVTPHGHYRDDYDFTIGRSEARAVLGVENSCTMVLTLGQIRPYKNIPALIRATTLLNDPAMTLFVAGRPDSAETANALRDTANGHPGIKLELGLLSDERLSVLLRAADLVVLPYRAIQNSGSAILALSGDRPVVVPALGAMTELAAQVGSSWVHTYAGDFSAQVLAEALSWLRTTVRPSQPDLSALDWPEIAGQTIAAFESVLAHPRGRSHDALRQHAESAS